MKASVTGFLAKHVGVDDVQVYRRR